VEEEEGVKVGERLEKCWDRSGLWERVKVIIRLFPPSASALVPSALQPGGRGGDAAMTCAVHCSAFTKTGNGGGV
jgi:hypothetical protein